ncbi:MAG: methionine ABC transporter substrate-binding protein [Lysobacteraceae bacterium SCN 69-123]|jgi:D-methionine transport system substrate-binding protein|uniref:MetQ/NlpA family ABC transporter substrate-binding protein n=1 Tax=Stenotrophomonas acidaminiphila TaxID=128780 RepID=UPI00086EBDA4|nr:MetQ/NlpA family ABC transporter substrate-binding protein [Stenotrophomonas acidaminiphila]MBN8800235.1 MetQ/NlpA family ABC transporter substrate-binding protein [Stenotrophomonas acidaminiphila]MDF9442075.1 methionine ABC transporter substrate-binding protein [Stenotrophomonas acidaminiphila]ODU41740.1 MAG: methionine ABC transporter substrate-binding protein [Xanthomonadaceae bacterium SCN 69-123]OJY77827.1 MAG: methionine ABC transporter substrate-binding protein [Stenotrophomonas sp. 6
MKTSLFRPLLAAAAVLALAACGKPATDESRLVVAATAVPHAEILQVVKPILEKQGVTLDVRVFNDYVQPNDQLVQKQVDANYFQTEPYLDAYNRDRKTQLVTVVGVHIEPFGAYSRRVKSLAELPAGADVVIPNDPSNNSRALILLDKAGVIKLKDPSNALSTQRDIIDNPKQLRFRELDSAMLPRVLDQVDLALINTNYALDAGLDPTRDALAIESKDSPYVNFLVARPDNRDDPRVQKLAKALTGPEVKAFIESKYQGAVLPAF